MVFPLGRDPGAVRVVLFLFDFEPERPADWLGFSSTPGIAFAVLSQWFQALGLSSSTAMILVLCLTPVAAVLMMLFRGHLYKALTGSSRRQRLFQRRQSLRT